EGPPGAVDLEEVGISATAAGPEVLVDRARALLVGGYAGGVATGAAPADVAGGQHIGVGTRTAIVLGAAVEEGAGDLGGQGAGLGRAVVELGDLEVAVALGTGGGGRADAIEKRPIVVENAPDPLIIADDQSWQTSRRIDHGQEAMLVGTADIEGSPAHARTIVGELAGVECLQGR